MISRLLSHDLPRSRTLAALLIVIVLGLLCAPFLLPGEKSLNVAAKILVFIVLVGSYDLLLGYTGIVSFAHTMFFGIGAYGVAIASARYGPSWDSLGAGVALALLLSAVLALLIGLFSLRVRAIFYSMMTLAVASAFLTLASQLHDVSGGEDGLNFQLPGWLGSDFLWAGAPFGWRVDGKLLSYYVLFVCAVAMVLMLLRIVNSPFGRVLQAIRENAFRAEAIGFPTIYFRILSNVLAALFATLAGCLLAVWLRYNGPDTSLAFEIMIDVTLIVVIGGMGTMYGAVVGTTLFLLAQNYLQAGMAIGARALHAIPPLAALVAPERWLLWLGVLFVLSIYFFPAGIVGRLRRCQSP